MKTYEVTMSASVHITVAVSANNEEEAKDRAQEVSCIEYANGTLGWESHEFTTEVQSEGGYYTIQDITETT